MPATLRSVLVLTLLANTPAAADRGGVGLGWFAGGRAAAETATTAGAAFSAAVLRRQGTAALRLTGGAVGIAAGFRDLIAAAEAGPKGYDAINHGARSLPDRPPTQLTIGEIRAWIAATPGQPHAIGRYQVIPSTLELLVKRLGLPDSARFTPRLQDRLADSLMEDAGFSALLAGEITPEAFMQGLARIWAGLPGSDGRSVYHGHAGNRATIGRPAYERQVRAILGG